MMGWLLIAALTLPRRRIFAPPPTPPYCSVTTIPGPRPWRIASGLMIRSSLSALFSSRGGGAPPPGAAPRGDRVGAHDRLVHLAHIALRAGVAPPPPPGRARGSGNH